MAVYQNLAAIEVSELPALFFKLVVLKEAYLMWNLNEINMEMHNLTTVNEQVDNLKPFVKILVKKFQPQQIICFSNNLISEETNGCFRLEWIRVTVRSFIIFTAF